MEPVDGHDPHPHLVAPLAPAPRQQARYRLPNHQVILISPPLLVVHSSFSLFIIHCYLLFYFFFVDSNDQIVDLLISFCWIMVNVLLLF